MRSQLWLLAASSHLASANQVFGQELDYRGGEAAYLFPRETKASVHDGANGWTPRPTEGPSAELVRMRQDWAMIKRQTTQNSWINDKTCGWRAETESEPFVCTSSMTCATNTDRVVGCTSAGAANPFFTMCLDYAAVQAGACDTVGAKTGCCMTSTLGECITYMWPGPTPRVMYRCYTERAIVTMLETPWVSETSSSSSSSTSSTTTSKTTTSKSSSSASSASAPTQTTTHSVPGPSDSGSNTGAIVGGVVGGVSGVALILGAIAFVMIRLRRKGTVSPGTTYTAVAPGDTSYHGGGPITPAYEGVTNPGYAPSSVSPQTTQVGYYAPSDVGGTLAPVPSMYDPRQSYYDPAKQSYYDPAKGTEQQQQAGYPTPPGGYAPYPGQYPGAQQPQQGAYAPYQPASELDTSTVPAGQHGNPIEMAAYPPAQR